MNPHSLSAKPIRLRERLREATSGAILEAAEQAFAEEGAKARMESIATRAGIAVGTLYNHFADREALWRAVCGAKRAALLARLDDALAEGERRPFAEALALFIDALLAHWAEHRGFLTVLVQTEPAAGRAGAKDRSMAQEITARAARVVRRGAGEGALRDGTPELHAAFLVGMMRQVLLLEVDQALDAPGGVRERVLDFFLHGAGRRP
jgi:AcrR family transcriptional regulator